MPCCLCCSKEHRAAIQDVREHEEYGIERRDKREGQAGRDCEAGRHEERSPPSHSAVQCSAVQVVVVCGGGWGWGRGGERREEQECKAKSKKASKSFLSSPVPIEGGEGWLMMMNHEHHQQQQQY